LPNLRLVFVGNGSFSSSKGGLGLSKSDRWRARLDEEVRRAGISDRVVFTGHVTQAELDALYERSDFSILPSVNEGFGLVVVESWIHRRPALVTDRAGVAELITDGENGLLFDPDSVTGLARQIRRITADDGTLRRRLVDGGRRTARTCSLETAARQERELFESLVGG
jgi:glycosyltransferase involved in cell wall biosynthesis